MSLRRLIASSMFESPLDSDVVSISREDAVVGPLNQHLTGLRADRLEMPRRDTAFPFMRRWAGRRNIARTLQRMTLRALVSRLLLAHLSARPSRSRKYVPDSAPTTVRHAIQEQRPLLARHALSAGYHIEARGLSPSLREELDDVRSLRVANQSLVQIADETNIDRHGRSRAGGVHPRD